MKNKTCENCINYDCGLCDRKGIWVDDDDACEKYRGETWKEAMTRTFLGGH